MARIVLTEQQFKNYMRRVLNEERKEDYAKKIIKEALESTQKASDEKEK